jgi:hypothetical protein
MIYTVVVIDHTARVDKLYMGQVLKVRFVGCNGHYMYRNLQRCRRSSLIIIVIIKSTDSNTEFYFVITQEYK